MTWVVVYNGTPGGTHINGMQVTMVEEFTPHKTRIRLACGKKMVLDMDHDEFLELIGAITVHEIHQHPPD